MPLMKCLNVSMRIPKVAIISRASFLCSRCRLQASKNVGISFQSQKRNLRTRPHKASTPFGDEKDLSLDEKRTLENEVHSVDARAENKNSAAVIDDPRRQSAQEDENDEDFEEEILEEDDQDDGNVLDRTREYVPATTWHGLKSLEPSEWDEQAHYEGFSSSNTTRERVDVEWAIHCALVEFYTLKQNGFSIDFMFSSHESKLKRLLVTKETAFEHGEDGALALRYLDKEKEKAAVSSLVPAEGEEEGVISSFDSDKPIEIRVVNEDHTPEEAIAADHGTLSAPEEVPRPTGIIGQETSSEDLSSHGISSQKMVTQGFETGPSDRSWMDISFTDPLLKFAILKRTSQILGSRIPDPQVASINDIPTLLGVLSKKPKSKRLIKEIKDDLRLQGLKNLETLNTRWTAKRNDMELGRAKVINQELRKRGIPSSWPLKFKSAERKPEA